MDEPTIERKPAKFHCDSRRAIVMDAIIDVAEADPEDDPAFHRAWCRFWASLRSAGWVPKSERPYVARLKK